MKRIIWGCDTCRVKAEGVRPPFGWVEASFYDRRTDKYQRFCFCCYSCLICWAESKEVSFGATYANNEGPTRKEVKHEESTQSARAI